jgi:malate dehydrogenase (oxaloacetate-decarboxylating)
MDDLRTVAATVATAVATAAAADGVACTTVDKPVKQVTEAMWRIEYPQLDLTTK